MARIRSISPEICMDQKLADFDHPRAERTWMRLWTHCDDDGRARDNPRLIKAAIYPLLDTMTHARVEEDIAALAIAGFLVRYEVDGEKYLHVPSFAKWQKPNRRVDSKLPPPPDRTSSGVKQGVSSEDSVSMHTNVPLVVVVGEVDVEGVVEGAVHAVGSAPAASRQATRATQIPKDFAVTAEMRAWASDRGIRSDLGHETEKFINHWISAGTPRKDWAAAWRNWLIKADEFGAGRGGRSGDRQSGAESMLSDLKGST